MSLQRATMSAESVRELSYPVIEHVGVSGALCFVEDPWANVVEGNSGQQARNKRPHRNPAGGNKEFTDATEKTAHTSPGGYGQNKETKLSAGGRL